MVKKLVCELNDYRISLLSKDELQYIEGFVFSLYSETFQTGNDMSLITFFIFVVFSFSSTYLPCLMAGPS